MSESTNTVDTVQDQGANLGLNTDLNSTLEVQRADALERYQILDTPPEDAFDRIGRLAVRMFSVPIALVSFIDRDRQWFKSCFGWDIRQTDRSISFCAHAILSDDDVMVVPNAMEDERFVDNPLVTGDYGVRFYAGAPLLTPDGIAIGTICILDTEPRDDFGPEDRAALADLAQMVIDELELRSAIRMLERSEAQHGGLLEYALDGVFALDATGRMTFVNPAFEELTGFAQDEAIGAHMAQFVHPEDIAAAEAMFAAARAGGKHRGHVRVRSRSGDYVYVDTMLARSAEGSDDLIYGSARNVTPQKMAELEARELATELETQVERLKSLAQVNQLINSSLDLTVTLNSFLEAALAQLRADAAQVMLYDPDTHLLKQRAVAGMRGHSLDEHTVSLGQGTSGRAALERMSISVPDVRILESRKALDPEFRKEGFISYHVKPLVAKGKLVGVFGIFHRTPHTPTSEWRELARALAMQAAIAIDNATMVENLQWSNTNLALAYDATIEGWARALDLKDEETEGHSRRVTELTARLARKLGMHGEELVHVRRGALLHDIGKMGIPDAILKKPGPLNDEEWDEMKRHTDYAYDALEPIAFLRPALEIPRYHHERFDGAGYPMGLKGRRIPLPARIFAVVDVWDALTSDRPYRKAWTHERTIEHMREASGTHFDPDVLASFLEMIGA